MVYRRDEQLDPGQAEHDLPPYQCQLHSDEKKDGIYNWVHNGVLDEIPPINFFFCAKHENRGKIESHLWFFKGFCSYVQPKYCQMIDIGTIPLRSSISSIIKYMDFYKQVGGCAGEIEVFEPTDRELGYPIIKKNKDSKHLSNPYTLNLLSIFDLPLTSNLYRHHFKNTQNLLGKVRV